MKLYHGTTEAVARLAFERGLSPRGDTGVKSTWEDNPSREDMVYLSRGYAPYFAACATKDMEKWGIVEVDTDLMEEPLLHPVEDFLEQATRDDRGDLCDTSWGMQQRTEWYRDHIEQFQHCWKLSVKNLGNCAYLGQIVPSEVTRVAIYDPKSNPSMTMMALDPMISIMNWSILGGTKYSALTDWFFGMGLQPGHFEPMLFSKMPPGAEEFFASIEPMRKALEVAIASRSGVELLERPVLA